MRAILTLTVFLLVLRTQAQERIDTDRPDQTESAFTVPKTYFQGEFGFSREAFTDKSYHLVHPAFLLKYGLSKRVELRLEGNFLSDYLQNLPDQKSIGLEPLEVGFKAALFEEKGFRPKTSLIVHLGLPFTASPSDHDQELYPSFRFLFNHTLGGTWGLGYNIGGEWDGYSHRPAWSYTLSPNTSIGRNWYAYVEAFGFLHPDHHSEHNLDGGFAYYISNDVKADISGGMGLGDSPLRYYVSLGFSFRFSLKGQAARNTAWLPRLRPAALPPLTSR